MPLDSTSQVPVIAGEPRPDLDPVPVLIPLAHGMSALLYRRQPLAPFEAEAPPVMPPWMQAALDDDEARAARPQPEAPPC